jgi:hypothetical protein
MAKAHTAWKVLPHGPIEKLGDRLWRVEGSLDSGPMKRVMVIARRGDDRLIVHNAIALGEPEMAAVDGWGSVAVIAVPSGYHRLDAPVFHERYPGARVVCPAGAKSRVAQVVPDPGSYSELAPDSAVELVTLDGTRQREGAMIVRGSEGSSLVFNDAVFNMPHAPGATGFVLRHITGSTGGPRVTRVMQWFVIADKRAFRAHLERLAALPDLRRIIVAHHLTINDDPAGTLRAVAATL